MGIPGDLLRLLLLSFFCGFGTGGAGVGDGAGAGRGLRSLSNSTSSAESRRCRAFHAVCMPSTYAALNPISSSNALENPGPIRAKNAGNESAATQNIDLNVELFLLKNLVTALTINSVDRFSILQLLIELCSNTALSSNVSALASKECISCDRSQGSHKKHKSHQSNTSVSCRLKRALQ